MNSAECWLMAVTWYHSFMAVIALVALGFIIVDHVVSRRYKRQMREELASIKAQLATIQNTIADQAQKRAA